MIGLAAVTAGCAAHQSPPSGVAGPLPTQAQASRVVIEGDGLPSQLAPRHRTKFADDPREPWSPNYGSVPSGATPVVSRGGSEGVSPGTVSTRIETARIAQKLDSAPAATWQPMSGKLSPDDIIRRAIAAHEMRSN